jgi:DNA-binding response OmpR family regulator
MNSDTTNLEFRVLVVEDDPVARFSMCQRMQNEGFTVFEAHSIAEARKQFRSEAPSVVILDMNLPDGKGTSLIKNFQSASNPGIIFVTQKSDRIDRLRSLELGADDFITKPVDLAELVIRVRNLAKRTSASGHVGASGEDVLRFGRWQLNLAARTLSSIEGEDVSLTRGEFDTLVALVTNAGKVLNRDQILDITGGSDAVNYDRAVDAMIRRLRKKIEVDSKSPEFIITHYGVGYSFQNCTAEISID